MKYDTSYRIIEEPGFLMKIVNWFREPCVDCGRYGVVYSRLPLTRRCSHCLNMAIEEIAQKSIEREKRMWKRQARILAEEFNGC